MRHKTSIARRLLQGLIIVTVTLVFLEASLRLLRVDPDVKITSDPWPFIDDDALGYRLKPNQTFEAKKTFRKLNHEITAYDVFNSTDEFGR